MPTGNRSSNIVELELEILRVLLESRRSDTPDSLTDAQMPKEIIAALSAYEWQGDENRVVFEALERLPGRSFSQLREQLPAQATRMGFPDVNWQKYFTLEESSRTKGSNKRYAGLDIATLVADLHAATRNARP
jgi:hypothetical protein